MIQAVITHDIDTEIIGGCLRGMQPEPDVTVSEWAEQKRILPPGSAAPGPFRNEKTPYMREIANKLSATDPAQTIIFKKSSQVGATELGNNWLGYTIDVDPSPFLYMMPTYDLMKTTSKKRIQPMIESTPAIRGKISPNKAKDSGNTILEKFFEGGSVTMVGANSPVGLSSVAVKKVYGDEIDRMPLDVGGEGSPVDLADTRTMTFGDRAKKFLSSTPTRKGQSLIDSEFEKTGQRFYHVPCPFCGGMQNLIWDQVRYEVGKYENTKYECIHCKELIPERFKPQMLSAGQWIPKFPEREDGKTFGYHINALYSPLGWYGWGKMAKEYEESAGNIPKRITWINTKKGECYEHEGESPQWEILYAQRKQDLRRNIPKANVAFITAGVDVQADRFEVEIVGWMKGKQSQSLDYRVIMGDTSNEAAYEALTILLNETFTREDGAQMQIALLAIDTGYNTSHVYNWCLNHITTGRVIPVKGDDGVQMIYTAPKAVQVTRQGKAINSIKVFRVGTSIIKSELYGWLKQLPKDNIFPPGYCYFPQYDEVYFRGLTAEKLESTTNKKGFTVLQWAKHYKRNEPLDCRVYARGAAAIYGMDLMQEQHWEKLIMYAGPVVTKPEKKEKKKRDSFWG
jgi:phage terminase large subunit GpA-like protein